MKELIMRIAHKPASIKEDYERIKKLHKKYPDIIMHPDEWKKRVMEE